MFSRSALGFVLVSALAGGELIAASLKDPTQPPAVHQTAVKKLDVTTPQHYNLSAIKISGSSRKALINGQFLSEGDDLGESRVVEISSDAVVVEYLSERRRIPLLPQRVRRDTTGQ